MTEQKLKAVIAIMATTTLVFILLAMVFVMLYGFFDDRIDNENIGAIMAPAFQTIIGGFIGLVTGIKIGSNG